MNTHDIDIELPAEFLSGNSVPVTVATIKRERMEEILRAAIEPYQKRIEELEAELQELRRQWVEHDTLGCPTAKTGIYASEADRQRRGEPTAAEISDVIREITGCPDIKNGEDSLVVALGMLFHRCATTQSSEPDYKQLFEQMCERCDALDAKLAEYSEREPVAWRYKTSTGWHATTDAAKALRVADHHAIEPLYSAPQPAEPVKLERPKCGADRSKAPCAGELMNCHFKGEAQPTEPVKVPPCET